MTLIPAAKKDKALQEEMDQLLSSQGELCLWWLGQSGFLLQWNGFRALLDPYLSDSLTHKYATTSKPHVRMSERVIDPSLLHGISVVTSSHNHTDHLDAETLIPVFQQNPGAAFIIPEANRSFVAERVKCAPEFPIGLNEGQSVQVGPFRFYGVAAKHNEIERDANGCCRFMGYLITVGNRTLYHSGDTLWYEELPDILSRFSIDIALLPINGNDPARGVAGNLDCREAALLGKQVMAGTVIPCHYQMFEFNTADPADFAKEAQTIEQPYTILKHGEYFRIPCI
jgi:L-ascorbate metabolism protein UlaG (beta-lactamase superfamily)